MGGAKCKPTVSSNLCKNFREKTLLASAVVFSMYAVSPVKAQSCGSTGLAVQVLGSGGPELQDKRASTSYLIWDNGSARVIVDAGGGSALRFGESGAQMSQLDVVLFSHFHIDHSGDFPALVFSSWFEDRKRPLPVFGPPGKRLYAFDDRVCTRPLQ
jgi:glyoxylase-like metal-dependent hydrolase (beta-lactamase superfamily II)